MKAQKSKWLYLKIGLYGILLYSVVSVMQYVKSPSFSGNVDILMGSPSQTRLFNWCTNSVQIVFVLPNEQTIREPKQIKDICQLAYSSYESHEVAKIQWSAFMKAMDEKGKEVVLEADPSLSFIKQGNLIYKVDGLKGKLRELGLAIE